MADDFSADPHHPMRHPDYQNIARRFRQQDSWCDDQPLAIPAENVDLFFLAFVSQSTDVLLGHDRYHCAEHGIGFPAEPVQQAPADHLVDENIHFRYPLVREHGSSRTRKRYDRAVMILHGLNERSFTKYIPWAYQLWDSLRVPVILFPLSFHITRVHPSWLHEQRGNFTQRSRLPGNNNLHRFNAVISDRLGSHPERLFWGAIQSYWDIVHLASEIRAGNHPHFNAGARIDLLGFSAGGFVALALLLENSLGLFSESRSVLFSTCAAMRDISLSSYLIVDQTAENALMNLYVKSREKFANPRLMHWFDHHPEGKWFRAFCGLMPERARLNVRLKEIAPRVLGIANTNDQIVPAGAIFNTLQGIRRDTGVRVEELTLGIHESPFVSDRYDPSDRCVVLESLDASRFGTEFKDFIRLAADHLRN